MVDGLGTIESHEGYRELLGSYALDALLPGERAALAAHLAECAECRVELDALRVGVKAFALLAGEREPSPELRNRVWETIWAEPNFNRADTVVAQEPQPIRPVAMPASIVEARAARSSRLPLLSAIAAALALLLVGSLLAWNLSLRGERGDLEATVVALEDGATTVGQLDPQAPGDPSGGQVQYLSDREVLLIELHDLPPLPEGQVYQLWIIVGDNPPEPSEVFVANETPGAPTEVWVKADPQQIDFLAITREPGVLGSLAPTTDPILIGEV